MSSFLNSLKDRLTAMEQEMQTLPGELDSVVTRLDWGKLRSLLFRLNQDFNQLLDELFTPQRSRVLASPLVIMPEFPFIRLLTSEDLSRWRVAHKSDVQVVIGKGRVAVMAASEVACKCKTTVSQIILVAQQQSYIVLSWDQYQKLSDEIGRLIGEDEERGRITGLPLPIRLQNKATKLLT